MVYSLQVKNGGLRMFDVIYYGYEFLCEFLPFVLLLRLTGQKNGRWLVTLFALYVICVFHVTGAGTLYEALQGHFLHGNVNLIPFSQGISLRGYGLNVVMFLPFGFLVPMLWTKLRKPGTVILVGLAFSLMIELSQLLCLRGTDVDDLLMNTLGTGLGYLIYLVWSKGTNSLFRQERSGAELPLFVLAMYLGRCLLFNQLGMIQLWYGY